MNKADMRKGMLLKGKVGAEERIYRVLDLKEKVLVLDCVKKTMPVWKTYEELSDYVEKEEETRAETFYFKCQCLFPQCKVSEYLVNNLSKKELDTCLSERELQPFIEDRLQEYLDKQEHDHYQELVDALQNNQLSMPDVIYKTELGTWEAIEITTDSYGNEEIESKTMTCELLSIEVTFVHT